MANGIPINHAPNFAWEQKTQINPDRIDSRQVSVPAANASRGNDKPKLRPHANIGTPTVEFARGPD